MSKMAEVLKADKILIGWASRDVTPDKPVILRGQFHVRISERVNDPLCATVLALESKDKKTQAIMVSIDTVGIQNCVRDKCRKTLALKIPDFDPQNLFINATHTHTAPAQPGHNFPPQAHEVMTDQAYFEILTNGIVEAVVDSWQSRKPGAVSWGCGQAVVGLNRRITYFDGMSKMYGNTNDENFSHIEGYEDHGVDMLFTYDSDRSLTGMIVNLACPSQATEGAYFVSADFWHETRTEIRKRHGEKIFILPQCSAAGDQSPHPLLHKKAEARMLLLKGFMKDENDDVRMAQRKEIGNRIANAIDEVLPLAKKDIREKIEFCHKSVILDLPRRMVTEKEKASAEKQVELHKEGLAKSKQDPADFDYSRNYVRIRYFQSVIDRFESQKTEKILPIEMHIIRLGDIAFATNRFEYFLDYGERIKARSKAVQTFVVQLAGAGKYLPTQRAVDAASYGAGIESNLVGPEGGQMIVNEQVRMINEMFSN